MSDSLRWKQMSVLTPNLWDGYAVPSGDLVATLREYDGRIWAEFHDDSESESFYNATFAKLWVEKQYAKRQA